MVALLGGATIVVVSRLRVKENIWEKRVEVTGEWRKLHNEELNVLYPSPNNCSGDKIETNEMGGACSAYGVGERRVQGFVGET